MDDFPYLHGFSPAEQARLHEQARFAGSRIHQDVEFPPEGHVLEVGCGAGAQSRLLLERFPRLRLTGIDRSAPQLAAAEATLRTRPEFAGRYTLHRMDATKLDFPGGHFDGAFLCWLLEHVPGPAAVLDETRRVLRAGAAIYVTEVLNATFHLHPACPSTWRYWEAYNAFQSAQGGDPHVGAKLGNLLLASGFREITTTSRVFHLDDRDPATRAWATTFWLDLLLSAAPQLLEAGRVDEDTVAGMRDELGSLGRKPGSVFYYAFVQARGRA